mmetsp:Transcript_11118/g.39321  ORF Transcript_11118/g.39321 Transcript_11118/m.39321 type:complete len:2003 (+) Transcript_11118:82-6090(+)
MSGSGGGSGRAPDVFEDEAVESGAEGAGSDGEDEDDDGRDLQGFIAAEDEGEGAAAGEQEGGSSSSDSDLGAEEELLEDDLAVLAEAGVDISQVTRKREGEAPAEGEPASLRQRLNAGAGPAGGLMAAVRAAVEEDDFGNLSDDSVDDFIVDDPAAAKRRRHDEAGTLGISEDQMQEIIDIFGDTSVLRPSNEIGAAAPASPTAAAPSDEADSPADDAAAAPPAAAVAAAKAATQALVQTPTALGALPLRKPELPKEVQHLPERWVKAYMSQDNALVAQEDGKGGGIRTWAEDEEDCEAKWIFQEAFSLDKADGKTEAVSLDTEEDKTKKAEEKTKKAEEKTKMLSAIREILKMLHAKHLEPVVIATQFESFFANVMYSQDIWTVCDLDQQHWQRVWQKFQKLKRWQTKAPTPKHIAERIDVRIFDQPKAELNIKDTADWFLAMFPDETAGSDRGHAPTGESQIMAAARKHKFDEKLGLRDSLEQMSLQVFGISPTEFGTNIAKNERLFTPEADTEDTPTIKEVCEEHRNESFRTVDAVQEAVTLYLAKLIACEPRIRQYVREKFMEMCAVSTFVTETGKTVAVDAAHTFKRSYRAFHITNRPLANFEKDDELFLDVLNLQRKGFVTVEYSLVTWPEGSTKQKYILMGLDEEELVRQRQKMAEHMKQMDEETRMVPPPESNSKEDLAKWNWCAQMRPRLEAISKSSEIVWRMQNETNARKKAESLFAGAKVRVTHDEMNKIMDSDPIFSHLTEMYCRVEQKTATEVFIVPGPWQSLRKQILLRALRDDLYPKLWAEAQTDLARRAEDYVCRTCAASLESMVDRQPWKPSSANKEIDEQIDVEDVKAWKVDDEDADIFDPDAKDDKAARMRGYISVMVIVPEVQDDYSMVAYVNQYGDPQDMRKLFSKFADANNKVLSAPPGNVSHLRQDKMREHGKVFKKMLRTYEPALVLLPIVMPDTSRLKQKIQTMIDELDKEKKFKSRPTVVLCDPTVPRLVAYDQRLMKQGAYQDCVSGLQRIALSMARYAQDPLAEICQLWDERPQDNVLLKLRLHRLQDVLPRNRLSKALEQTLIQSLARGGVHVNRLRLSAHLMSVIPFLPGFGPSRVHLFRKCLSNAITSRHDLVGRIGQVFSGASQQQDCAAIVANCIPFIRIAPDLRDLWPSSNTPGFDRTRLTDGFRPWVEAMCKVALKDAEQDEGSQDVVARAMKEYQGQKDTLKRKLDDDIWGGWNWEAEAGLQFPKECANADKFLDFLVEEIAEPCADKRQPYGPLSDDTMFSLAVSDALENYCPGALVHAIVGKDLEFLDAADEKDNDRETKASVKVKVYPCEIAASFQKQYKVGDGKGYVAGCDREFKQGESIIARITRTMASEDKNPGIQLTVDMESDMFVKDFPVSEWDAKWFVPATVENWLTTKLGVVCTEADNELANLKTRVRRPRNIRHPNWFDDSHEMSLRELAGYPMGNVLFRPSKRHEVIIGMLKVRATDITAGDDDIVDPQHCFRSFDIVELENKTESTGYELAHKLKVDGIVYKNFDEIIARHMDPIMDNLRVLREHPRFGADEGEKTDKPQVVAEIKRQSSDDLKRLCYSLLLNPSFAGHGMLIWALAGRQPREEYVDVHPQGFSLWGQPFEKLADLLKWFKTKGWRQSTVLRREFKEAWATRQKDAEERRGKNAFGDRERKTKSTGWGRASTTLGGLQTPGGTGGLSTPKGGWGYTFEAAAPTPGGSRTPNSAVPGSVIMGNANPTTPRNPGTPNPLQFSAFGGAMGSQARPATMSAQAAPPSVGGGQWFQQAAPGTAGGGQWGQGGYKTPAQAPATPSGMGGGLGGGAYGNLAFQVPSTPVGLSAAGTPGAGMYTPGGFRMGTATPGTPGGVFVPNSPAGQGFGTVPHVPNSPAGPGFGYQPFTPVGAGQGFGQQPKTPVGAGFGVPNTPGGPGVPNSPAGFGVPSSPAGIGAAAPSPAGVGFVPQTPRAAFSQPQTPGAGGGGTMSSNVVTKEVKEVKEAP